MRAIGGLGKGLAVVLGGAAALDGVRTLIGGVALAGALPEVATAAGWGGITVLSALVWLGAWFGLVAFSAIAAANVRSFEPEFHEGPGSAVLGWVIPAWNLYKPWDTLSAVWSGTANHPRFEDPAGPSRILDVFWVCWVASIVLGRLFAGGSEEWLGWADVAAAALSAVAGGAGAAVVLRIAALQEQARAAEPAAA